MAIDPEDLVGPEWAEWYRMSPIERWEASARMWADYLALGGSLDPEPDTDSPFFDEEEWRTEFGGGGSNLPAVRRSGV